MRCKGNTLSIEALNLVFKADVRPARNKHVLTILANYANEHGETFPSYDRIQRDTCMSRATIAKALKSLEADGYFTKKLIANDNGTRAYNKYSLDLEKLGQSSHVKLTPKVQLSRPKVQSEGVQSSTGRLEPLITTNNPNSNKKNIKRKSSINEDWELPDDYIQFVKDKDLCHDVNFIKSIGENFKDHHLKNGTKFADWKAAWRTWCRSKYMEWPAEQEKTVSQILEEINERQNNANK